MRWSSGKEDRRGYARKREEREGRSGRATRDREADRQRDRGEKEGKRKRERTSNARHVSFSTFSTENASIDGAPRTGSSDMKAALNIAYTRPTSQPLTPPY